MTIVYVTLTPIHAPKMNVTGNWDLVGNNTPIFFIRDPILFPSFIHTQARIYIGRINIIVYAWVT